ncbi:type IX secretion system membrane protein PorP/SprF [bacterium]|nr:type IX secretion system membrane protein PorP/SprF [bacterium]
MHRYFALGFLLILVLSVWAMNIEDEYGARPLGMGRTYVSIANDGYASLWNPAGMDFFKERTLTGMFSRLYWGIDNDAIGQGFLSYIHHWDKMGSAGISVAQLFSERWWETRVALGYGHKIGRNFSIGFNAKILRNEVVRSNISYTPQPGDDEHGIVDPRDDPFFENYGWNKMSFTADVGMMYQPNQKLSIGLMAANLTQPDMSFQGIGADGAEPMSIRVGASYWIKDHILPAFDIRYLNDKINGKTLIRPHLGGEYWLKGKNIAFRTGYNPEEFAFGFTYRSRKTLDLQIDYAFIYPLSDIRLTGATSHKLSATLRFLPPAKPLFDLALRTSKMSVYPQNAIIGEPISVKAVVENLGERPVTNYKVSLYYEDPEQGWVLAAPVRTVDEKLVSGESKELEWDWTATEKGHYQFFASVDDDGISIPKVHSSIDEIDEDNNTGFVEFSVFPLPEGTVSPVDNSLEISQVTLVREEEPIVPVIFFDPMAHRVDERFHHILEVIANRLTENPDININLFGYYNPESDGDIPEFGEKLGQNRAKAVRSVLLVKNPQARSQIHIADVKTYDPSFHRTGKSSDHLPKDRPLAESENRRAKLKTYVKGFQDWEPVVFFNNNSSKVAKGALETLRKEADKIHRVMERNSEVIFLIEGFVNKNEKNPIKLSFDRAYNIKKALGEILGENFVKKYSRRIFIRGNTDTYADKGKARIGISGESLVFRPMEGKWAAKDYELQEDQTNFVKITSHVEAGVDSYKVSVIDEDGKLFRTLAKGSGSIPSGVPWDWRDENGNLINPKTKYYVQLDIKDRLGQRFTTKSDPVSVNVKKRQQEIETLIIVQFVFDEKTSESKFLESRVEYIARKFIEKALEPKKSLLAEVGGHTDVIGMQFRNRELSLFRAQKEYENLRQYLIYLLGLSGESQLDNWFREHHTTLTYKGYADAKPYIITKWQEGKLVKKEIGNDTLPEGRTINRRVVIEFYMEKEGAKKATKEEIPPQSMR